MGCEDDAKNTPKAGEECKWKHACGLDGKYIN